MEKTIQIKDLVIVENDKIKTATSENYNFFFDKITGAFARWGKDFNDDPTMSPYGPEIVDIEISKICSKGCTFCYKENTPCGENMSFETFKKIFNLLPATTTQIAFGVGDVDANPNLIDIFKYCKNNGVVPNITISGSRMTEEYFRSLAELCGSIAISRYNPVDECYNAVKTFIALGKKQINLHCLLALETYDECFKAIDDVCSDERLKGLNCIVFLSLKEKGRAVGHMHSLRDPEKYKALVEYAFEKKVSIGFDSCSAPLFQKAIEDREDYKSICQMVEPCESTLFSMFIDVEGKVE